MSLDVKSLFTSIPRNTIIEIVEKKWRHISAYTTITKKLIIDAINLCFDHSYIAFRGKIYQQIDGCAMGNPLSQLLAALIVDDIITKSISEMQFKIPLIKSYVDDLLMAIPKNSEQQVLRVFNKQNTRVQFTIERENNEGHLPFLDIVMMRQEDGKIDTKWYMKPTTSGRILNYSSNHKVAQKLNIAMNLISRSIRLTDEKYRREVDNKIDEI